VCAYLDVIYNIILILVCDSKVMWFTISGYKENANQNHTKIPPHPLEQLSSKSPPTINVGEDVGEKEPCWWKCKLVQSLWKTIWRLLRKLNIYLKKKSCDCIIRLNHMKLLFLVNLIKYQQFHMVQYKG
jgi:hypothetical protein